MKKFGKFILGMTSILALASCGSKADTIPVEENGEETVEVTESPSVPVLNAGSSNLFSNILGFVGAQGRNLVDWELATWGVGILDTIFESIGLDFLSSSETDYTAYFEEINTQLADIQKTLSDIEATLEQSEASRILDNFYNTSKTMNNAINPIIAAFAECAKRESAAATEEEKAAILEEEKSFYEGYVKNLRLTNSFTERVIALAELISKPSSNAKYTLMRCFDVVNFDAAGLYAWENQRIDGQGDFLVYVTNTLLNATALARYEIVYCYDQGTSIEKTFWSDTNKSLDTAVENALDIIQKETNDLLEKERSDYYGHMKHIATGIRVDRRLGESTFDKNKGHNILSYYRWNQFTDWSGHVPYQRIMFHRHNLDGDNDLLMKAMMSDYATYLKKTGTDKKDFTFINYLSYVGFTVNSDWSEFDGLFWQMKYEEEFPVFETDHQWLNAYHINKEGVEDKGTICYVDKRFWKSRRFRKGEAYSHKFLILLKPGTDYAIGHYKDVELHTDRSDGHEYLQNFPWEYNFTETVEKGRLAYCDPSW